MAISRDQVEQVALLARLQLSNEELSEVTAQLSEIVDYVRQLEELDTRDVEPLAHALDVSNVFAADALGCSLKRGEALAVAPDQDGQYYLVPAVLGE